MSCPTIIDVTYPPSSQMDVGLATGALPAGDAGSTIPNPGAGCAAATGVLRLKQRVAARVRLPLKDDHGNVIVPVVAEGDSSSDGLAAVFTIRESAHSRATAQLDADSFADGYAIVSIPGIQWPGLYEGSMTVYDGDAPVASTRYWVEVAATLDWRSRRDPLTIAEVRLELRDQCAGQNELLDKLAFTDDQLAWAIRKPVDEFNSTGQPYTNYTPSSFPGMFRAQWSSAAVGYLMRLISIGNDRDNLAYQAGGVSINMNDISFVAKLSQVLLQEWRDWLKAAKMNINIEAAYGSLGSDYGSGAWG